MKRTFKFTMAALATVALASCSNDDFFGSNENVKLKKNTLNVEVADLVDPMTTRSAFTHGISATGKNAAKIWWQGERAGKAKAADEIRVFDKTMMMYDKYRFTPGEDGAAGLFTLYGKDERNLKDNVEYALFLPDFQDNAKYNANNGWDYETNNITVYSTLKDKYTLIEDEKTVDDVVAFQCDVPLWGTAKYVDDNVDVELDYLTAIVGVYLENVPGNATTVTVKGWEDQMGTTPAKMVGQFEAVISENGEKKGKGEAKLVPIEGKSYTGEIAVDISGATKAGTFVLIPVIAQKYGKIQVLVDSEVIFERYNTTLNIGTLYDAGTKAFDFVGGAISDINACLASLQNEAKDITIKTTAKQTKITTDDGKEDNKLIIPDMKAGKVTLDLRKLQGDQNITKDLYISSPEDAFHGTLVLHVDAKSYLDNIHVNLPNADVVFSGNFGTADLGKRDVNTKAIEYALAKSITILDPKTTTGREPEEGEDNLTVIDKIYVHALCGSVGADADVKLGENTEVGELILQNTTNVNTIALNGKLENELDVAAINKPDGGVITVTVGGKANLVGLTTNQKSLTIGGEAVIGDDTKGCTVFLKNGGDVIVDKARGDEDPEKGVTIKTGIEIEGEGTFTIKGVASIARLIGNEVTKVEVDNKSRVELINTPKAEVTFLRQSCNAYAVKADKVTLNNQSHADGKSSNGGGVYANQLTVNTKAYVAYAEIAGDVTIARTEEGIAVTEKLSMTGEESTLDLSGGYINLLHQENPIYFKNEEKVPTAMRLETDLKLLEKAEYEFSKWCGQLIDKDKAEYATYLSGYNLIVTPSQLAMLGGNTNTGAIKLQRSMDLGINNKWTPVALNRSFDGNDKTIKNLKIETTLANNGANVGLFSTIADGTTIEKLTVKDANVSVTGPTAANQTASNVGILFGSALGGATVNKVTVNGSVVATGNVDNVGGFAGSATVSGKTLTLTEVKVSTSKIQGRYNIGGLLGSVATLGATNCTIAVESGAGKGFVVNGAKEYSSTELSNDNAGSVGMYAGKLTTSLTATTCTHPADFNVYGRRALGFTARFKAVEGYALSYYFGGKDQVIGSTSTGTTVSVNTKNYQTNTIPVTVYNETNIKEKYGLIMVNTVYPADPTTAQ